MSSPVVGRSQASANSVVSRPQERGWSLGCVSAIDSNGRTIWIADAHRDDGKRLLVHRIEKLTAFLELEIGKIPQLAAKTGEGVIGAAIGGVAVTGAAAADSSLSAEV